MTRHVAGFKIQRTATEGPRACTRSELGSSSFSYFMVLLLLSCMPFTSLALPLQNSLHTKDHIAICSSCLKFPCFAEAPFSACWNLGVCWLLVAVPLVCLFVFQAAGEKSMVKGHLQSMAALGKVKAQSRTHMFSLLNSWGLSSYSGCEPS